MIAAMIPLAAVACGGEQQTSPLEDLELVAVDFELNSFALENTGDTEVRTQGLWAYRDGEQFEFDIFIVEPRSTILFSMGQLGEISTSAGELALADSDDFDSASLLEYVAWGDGELQLSTAATEAGLWPPDVGTVDVPPDSLILIRVDPTGTGPIAWQASDQID